MKPFHLDPRAKQTFIIQKLNELTEFHRQHCSFYDKYLDAFGYSNEPATSLESFPFLPARFFKEFSLKSVQAPVVIAESSGTNGNVSKINLSHKTMLAQSAALNKIMRSFLGSEKQPMLIIGAEPLRQTKDNFNARSAAFLGFKNFADPLFFAYDHNQLISLKNLHEFFSASKFSNRGIIFGFTADIWEFVNNFDNHMFNDRGPHISVIHGGGWKRLQSLNISEGNFKLNIKQKLAITDVFNYYGMIEQAGSIYFQCSHGKMHSSMFSDVIARDVNTLKVLPPGEDGVLQVFSTLPESYPGHSILTEDLGYILEDTQCGCGRFGTSVVVKGRLFGSEIRGCSDAYGTPS